jgi:SAM-dependent methyltransferase
MTAARPDALGRWRADLAAWAIPAEIAAQAAESPWVLPRQVFTRRAQRHARQPFGISFDRARAALQPRGEVLDVGAGAGAASLPLAPWASRISAVDVDADLLGALVATASGLGVDVHAIHGSWPQVARQVAQADVVTCYNVLYNIPDLEPFITALTEHARRRVVVEVTRCHPLTGLNDLWQRFHGLRRPEGPTADDLLAILRGLGLGATAESWTREAGGEYASFGELVDVTRRRLCLPPGRADEVATALRESGLDPAQPPGFGSPGRELVTIWWPPDEAAGPRQPARPASAKKAAGQHSGHGVLALTTPNRWFPFETHGFI